MKNDVEDDCGDEEESTVENIRDFFKFDEMKLIMRMNHCENDDHLVYHDEL